jgi:hypothetical protein
MAKRRSKGGRPRKSGARHPCGKLRAVRDEGSERTMALRLRFRPFQGGKGDQYAGTPIGRAWLVGLLDGHEVDPAAIRDAGLAYAERYWGYWPAPGGVSNYEAEDRRAAPFAGGLDIAGDRFQAIDATIHSTGRASYDAVHSLVVDPHWFPEENPAWLDRLINSRLGAAGRTVAGELPREGDAAQLALAVEGLLALVRGRRRRAA